jgi:hypothetical protein
MLGENITVLCYYAGSTGYLAVPKLILDSDLDPLDFISRLAKVLNQSFSHLHISG